MGEAKRRKKLDPNFGKIRRTPKFKKNELEKFQQFMEMPLSEYANPEKQNLFEEGIEQLCLMGKAAGVDMPELPSDPEERKNFLNKLKERMASTDLKLPDGTKLDI